MNTEQLNKAIAVAPFGVPLRFNKIEIESSVFNGLVVPINLPSHGSITFEDVVFPKVTYFQRQGQGRAAFKNCKFLSSTFFQGITGGDCYFEESVQFGIHVEINNCVKLGFQFSKNCLLLVDQSPLNQSAKKFNVLNLLATDSSQIYLQVPRFFGHLNFFSSQGSFRYLDLDADELSLELISCSVEFLRFYCSKLIKLHLPRTKIESCEFKPQTIYSVKRFYSALHGRVLDRNGIEELSRAARRGGNEKDFLRLMTFATKVWLKTNIELYFAEIQKAKRFCCRLELLFSRFRYWIQYYLVIKPTGRFYKWENIVGIQLLQVFLFALIYTHFGQFHGPCANMVCSPHGIDLSRAFYFSGMTSITISYGDYVPMGGLKAIALLQGFLGATLNLLFAFTLSRRYSSSQ